MTTLRSIDEIRIEVERICEMIGASTCHYTHITYDKPSQIAIPFVKVDKDGYHYIVMERGRELKHVVTLDFQELLYLIFSGITFSMALDYISDYKLAERTRGMEQRRFLFMKQLELLRTIDPNFEKKRRLEIMKKLEEYPFADGFPDSLEYAEEYLKKSKEDENDEESAVVD